MAGFIEVSGIRIDVCRKKGNHSLSLRINRKTGLPQISIPWLCPLFMARRFILAHLAWLKANIQSTPKKQAFTLGMQICLLGQNLQIEHTDLKQGVFIQDNTLFISGEETFCHRRVKDFIKKYFYNYVCLKSNEYAQKIGKKILHISIRDTSSRWGSCSSSAHLSFCWRLALAPTFVIDYVVAHEVAHLAQMNHSLAFWQEVKKINNEAYSAKKWLKENSAFLHSFI